MTNPRQTNTRLYKPLDRQTVEKQNLNMININSSEIIKSLLFFQERRVREPRKTAKGQQRYSQHYKENTEST